MLHINHTLGPYIHLSCAHTCSKSRNWKKNTVFHFEQPHSHYLFSCHAREKVMVKGFPLSLVCWIMFMPGLSGPTCLISNFSSNLNLSTVFFNRNSTLLITGATPLAISASDVETKKDTSGIIWVKTTVLEYDHEADYFVTIYASFSADYNSYCTL